MDRETTEPAVGLSRRADSLRFLLYSHDGLGLGHTRRHLAVAQALAALAPDSSVLLATGAEVVSHLGLAPQIDILKLPGLRKVSNEQYVSRRLRISVPEIRALRSALLSAAVREYRPTVVLVDKHPFGAKGEFREGLEELRAGGGRAVLGLRDILDEPANVLKEWSAHRMRERIAEFYDLVLVYGERSVFDPVFEYQFPPSLADCTRFSGYVLNLDDADTGELSGVSRRPRPGGARPTVLATAGGGEDGFFLLRTFIGAAVGASWEGIAVAGPMSPGTQLKTLQRMAAQAGVTLHTYVPNLSHLFPSIDALVCMGGYNTLVEATARGVPTVCVPRTFPRCEQLIRARAFERLGLLSLVEPQGLNSGTLRRAIQSVMTTSREELLRRVRASLSFDGARQAARHILALCGRRAAAIPARRQAAWNP